MFVLTYSNKNDDDKRFKGRIYHLPKDVIKNDNIIIIGKNFYDQPIDSDIKRYQEIRKVTIGEDQDYITERLLDYDYIKNHHRLSAVDLSRQKNRC